MADEKIIFSMNGVGKILPHNNRVILKDIYLSFFRLVYDTLMQGRKAVCLIGHHSDQFRHPLFSIVNERLFLFSYGTIA